MREFYNSRRQLVGYITELGDDKIYLSERSMDKGQIFCKKTYFEGKYLPNGVALDSEIIRRLIQLKINKIKFKIKNFEKEDFYAVIELKKFLDNSVKINYDVGRKTGYGNQRVCSLDLFEKIYKNQERLIKIGKSEK